jgi:hypothetical protein
MPKMNLPSSQFPQLRQSSSGWDWLF